MDNTYANQSYIEAVNCFPSFLRAELLSVEESRRDEIQEICLQAGRPLMFSTAQGVRFGTELCSSPGESFLSAQTIQECFRALCGYSVHTHQEEIHQGYLSIPGGHRAGLAGTAVIQDGQVIGIRDITAIYLRIARRIPGCARTLMEYVFEDGLHSLLLAGAPGSGKTTVLKDLAYSFSSGRSHYRTVVVDERFEICGGQSLGETCCVLGGFPKAQGILQAVRTLAPQVIICDEIGTEGEIQAVSSGLNSGVYFITSIHAAAVEELEKKVQFQMLREIGAIEKVAILYGRENPGQVKKIIDYKNGGMQECFSRE